jgi:hypothetical protein
MGKFHFFPPRHQKSPGNSVDLLTLEVFDSQITACYRECDPLSGWLQGVTCPKEVAFGGDMPWVSSFRK